MNVTIWCIWKNLIFCIIAYCLHHVAYQTFVPIIIGRHSCYRISDLWLILHTATYFDIVRQILRGLYVFVQNVFVSSCIRNWVLDLNDRKCQYNVPWHKMHCKLHWDEILVGHILSRLYRESRKYKLLRIYNRKVSPLCGIIITAILTGTC